MKVRTLILNADGDPHFQSEDDINVESLIEIAKPREDMAREKGADWTAGAISFFGSEIVKAVNTGEHDDVTKAIFQMLMATWLFDSLYCGISVAHYRQSELQFTITSDGVVAHTRVPATTTGTANVSSTQNRA